MLARKIISSWRKASLSSCFVERAVFSIHHLSAREVSKCNSIVTTLWRLFGDSWLFLSSSSFKSTVCCMPVSLLLFKGRILLHNPSQLWQIARPIKENHLARPKRGDHMLQHDLPSTLPSSNPWDLPSEGLGVTALDVSSALEPWGKHGDWRQTRQLALALTWESPQDQPPVRSQRLCHTSKATVEGNCQQADLPPPPLQMLPLLLMLIILLCCVGGERVEGWNHREITQEMAWIGLDTEERTFLLLWVGLWCYCLRRYWSWRWVEMCIAGDKQAWH